MTSFLIDSNVLISSYDETEKQHPESYLLVGKAVAGELQAFLAHQNILEYLAVVTDPGRVENPLSTRNPPLSLPLTRPSGTGRMYLPVMR